MEINLNEINNPFFKFLLHETAKGKIKNDVLYVENEEELREIEKDVTKQLLSMGKSYSLFTKKINQTIEQDNLQKFEQFFKEDEVEKNEVEITQDDASQPLLDADKKGFLVRGIHKAEMTHRNQKWINFKILLEDKEHKLLTVELDKDTKLNSTMVRLHNGEHLDLGQVYTSNTSFTYTQSFLLLASPHVKLSNDFLLDPTSHMEEIDSVISDEHNLISTTPDEIKRNLRTPWNIDTEVFMNGKINNNLNITQQDITR